MQMVWGPEKINKKLDGAWRQLQDSTSFTKEVSLTFLKSKISDAVNNHSIAEHLAEEYSDDIHSQKFLKKHIEQLNSLVQQLETLQSQNEEFWEKQKLHHKYNNNNELLADLKKKEGEIKAMAKEENRSKGQNLS